MIFLDIHCMLTCLYVSWNYMCAWFVQQQKKNSKTNLFSFFPHDFKKSFWLKSQNDLCMEISASMCKWLRKCIIKRNTICPLKRKFSKCNLYVKVMKCYLGSQHKYEYLNIRYKTIEAIRFKILLCNYTFCYEYYFHSSSFSFLLCYVLNARLTSERWI